MTVWGIYRKIYENLRLPTAQKGRTPKQGDRQPESHRNCSNNADFEQPRNRTIKNKEDYRTMEGFNTIEEVLDDLRQGKSYW